jgi:hypothetical protein
MSLSSWSYPFYDEKPTDKRATSRKKINQPLKPSEPPSSSLEDEGALADFKPSFGQDPPPPPVQKSIPPPLVPSDSDDAVFAPAFDDHSDISQRLNHIIRMLEQQQDDKTGRVAEEMILYVFLGIFVIFVLDSFVKTGKYSR